MKFQSNQILLKEFITFVSVATLTMSCKAMGPSQSSLNNTDGIATDDSAKGAGSFRIMSGVTSVHFSREKIVTVGRTFLQFRYAFVTLDYTDDAHTEKEFIIQDLGDGKKLIKYPEMFWTDVEGERYQVLKPYCLTNKGYKKTVEFEVCNENNENQKMSWNPDASTADPVGAFIKNGNLCLDADKATSEMFPFGEVRFWNCKDHPGEAGVNFNQRFYRRPK